MYYSFNTKHYIYQSNYENFTSTKYSLVLPDTDFLNWSLKILDQL